MIDISTWMNEFIQKLDHTFENRVWFVGLQGSYGRGEATKTSDIEINPVIFSEDEEHKFSYEPIKFPVLEAFSTNSPKICSTMLELTLPRLAIITDNSFISSSSIFEKIAEDFSSSSDSIRIAAFCCPDNKL